MPRLTFHLIPNAHLDPVWLWDWREGLNEGIITVRTILDLMDEHKDLTFIRGEAAIYQHIERHDPKTFRRIARHVKSGRWDVVGGTMIQPDTNLPMTETFSRHFARAQNYFISRFGKPARVAWAADSFGHSAGLPEILADAGIHGFAFTRPAMPANKPAFWWEGPGGSRVMGYHPAVAWYGCEREEMISRLDQNLAAAGNYDINNVGVFLGLGNHGGGPTRRHLQEIAQWARAHPQVRVIYSGLHKLFEALSKEVKANGDDFLPTHRGEMNFVLRGCYSAVAKYKFIYRKAEALLSSAERTDAIISAATKSQPADLGEAWDGLLFNSFHDILPGSSIERAFDEQIEWMGGVIHRGQEAEVAALNRLAMQVDTRVPAGKGDNPSAVALLVWNPHPQEFRGHVELEASLDYRPIWAYRGRDNEVPLEVRRPGGKPLPFQVVRTEHSAMTELPWRKRVVVPVVLPPLGWSVVSMQYKQGAAPPAVKSPATARDGAIDNGIYRVTAAAGGKGIRIARRGKDVLGKVGLTAITVEDPWGSWGGMAEEPESLDLSHLRHEWKVSEVQTLETGPQRATLWVRLTGGNSRLDLSFALYRGRDAVDVFARVFWDERSARLKLVMPVGDRAEFDVPGATVTRPPAGEVPGGRWVRVKGKGSTFGFASDALYNFDCRDGAFRATVVRASRYANDVKTAPSEEPWRPAVDSGELKFRFLLTPGNAQLPALARQLEEPPAALHVPSKPGPLKATGSFASLAPSTMKLLSLKPAENGQGLILRLQETSGKSTTPQLNWLGRKLDLGSIEAFKIATWRLMAGSFGWKVDRSDTIER